MNFLSALLLANVNSWRNPCSTTDFICTESQRAQINLFFLKLNQSHKLQLLNVQHNFYSVMYYTVLIWTLFIDFMPFLPPSNISSPFLVIAFLYLTILPLPLWPLHLHGHLLHLCGPLTPTQGFSLPSGPFSLPWHLLTYVTPPGKSSESVLWAMMKACDACTYGDALMSWAHHHEHCDEVIAIHFQRLFTGKCQLCCLWSVVVCMHRHSGNVTNGECKIQWKVFQIGTVHYNWPRSAHASQAFNIVHCTNLEDLPIQYLL